MENGQRDSQISYIEIYLNRVTNSHHVGWSPKIEKLSLVQLIKSEVKSRRYISSRKPGVRFDFFGGNYLKVINFPKENKYVI